MDTQHSKLIIGVDAVNIRGGGGLTHLQELLAAADSKTHGFDRIVVWATAKTAASLPQRAWLEVRTPPILERGTFVRAFWQAKSLAASARQAGCDVLLVPGGTYIGRFRPAVVMSQNLLPFDSVEVRRYGLSTTSLRLLLLRLLQSHSFRRAQGVVFLTEFSRRYIRGKVSGIRGLTAVVPHGIGGQFRMPPRPQMTGNAHATNKPWSLIYVSTVIEYKHQWNVVEAVDLVRAQGYSVQLHLIGSAYKRSLKRLLHSMSVHDPAGDWAHYHGPVPYEQLQELYRQADVGIFASSCENLPIILLEMMAASLPIACSNRGPMPDILRDAGVYFDPEDPADLAQQILLLLQAPEMRDACARKASELSRAYTWDRCAAETFAFIREVAHNPNGGTG